MSADRRGLLSVRQLPGSEVLRIVEEIRALVVGRYGAAACAAGTMSRVARDRALSSLRLAVERALRATFIRASGPLENLPPSALSLVCDYLAHGEIVALSQTSRRLHDQIRAYLAPLADTNRETPTAAPYLFGRGWFRNGHAERRTVSVDIRNPELLSDFGEVFDVLAGTMSLVQYLSLDLTWNPIIENGFLRALSEPAPHIESFTLVVHQRMVDLSFYTDYTLPEITQDLFASSAPSLTRCSLHGVKLPPASSTAFQAVTCFDYSPLAAVTITEISHILVLMPRLQTLGLMVNAFRALSDDVPGSSEATTHSTLRNVFLWTHESCALPWIPQFQGVTNVALVGSAAQVFETLPFRTPHGACLRYWQADALVFARLISSDLDICFRLHHARIASQVTAYPLTWLCIDECVWPDNDEAIMPAMNTLDTLTVTFAPCFTMTAYSPHAGLFATACTPHGAPDTRWTMPRLRELRVSTAPWTQDSPSWSNHGTGCHCARMTISLHDIAALIQHSISFQAPKLETVVLAGLEGVDYDFASAWSNLMRFTGRIDMEEEHDTTYAFRIPGTPGGLVRIDLEKYFAM